MEAHLREWGNPENGQKRTCLGRSGASPEPPAHLREKSPSHLTLLLTALREFICAWELHQSFIPASENEEERAVRVAAARALTVVEDHARWLEADLSEEKISR